MDAKTVKVAYRAAVERMGTADRRSKSLKRKVERKEAAVEKLSAENARFVKFLSEYEAKRRFPDAEWEDLDGVVVAKEREGKAEKSKNEMKKFEKELEIAKILTGFNYSVHLLPEDSGPGKKPDAIVNGMTADFKEVKFTKIEHRLSEGLGQADCVCLKIDTPEVTVSRILGKLKVHKSLNGKTIILILNGIVHKILL